MVNADGFHGHSLYFNVVSYFKYSSHNFNAIKKSQLFNKGENFRNGMAAIKNQNGWGFIDTNFENVIPCQYEYVEAFSEELSFVKRNNKHFTLIDKKGNIVLDFLPNHRLKGIKFKNDFACICLLDKTNYDSAKLVRQWAIINKEGKILVM